MMTREKDVAINSVCCELPCRGTGPQSTRGLVRTLCGRVCGYSASHRCLLYPHVSGFVCRHATQAADIINELCVSARNEWGVTSSQQVGWENYPHVRHAPQERTHLPSLDGLSPWSFSFYYCYTPTVLTTRAGNYYLTCTCMLVMRFTRIFPRLTVVSKQAGPGHKQWTSLDFALEPTARRALAS